MVKKRHFLKKRDTEGIGVERVPEDNVYALTITCNKDYTGWTPKRQLADRYETFMLLSDSCKYRMWAELTLQGKIHFHGIIEIVDLVRWYKYTRLKLEKGGFMVIKKQFGDDKDIWLRYCEKSSSWAEKVFECEFPITSINWKEKLLLKEKFKKQKEKSQGLLLDFLKENMPNEYESLHDVDDDGQEVTIQADYVDPHTLSINVNKLTDEEKEYLGIHP